MTFTGTIDIGVFTIDHIYGHKNEIIISSTQKKDSIIMIFDENWQCKRTFGRKGKASDEWLYPMLCSVDKYISILDNGKRSLFNYDFKGNLVNRINLENNIYQQCKSINDSMFIAEYKTTSGISLYNIEIDREPDLICNLEDFQYKTPDPNVYFGYLTVSNKYNTIVYAHQYQKSILLLNLDGSIKQIIKRTPQRDPIIDNQGFNRDQSTSYYWNQIQKQEDSFWVCCINKSGIELADNLYCKIEFEEYDYSGTPLRKIIIDRFVSSFYIDNNLLYGVLIDSNEPLGVFSLHEDY